jgi:RNA-directed DNA polymerase
VQANKGSPGVDGMTVIGIKDYLQQHWPAIREQLLNGTYEPKPVRRVEIPKPDGGCASWAFRRCWIDSFSRR